MKQSNVRASIRLQTAAALIGTLMLSNAALADKYLIYTPDAGTFSFISQSLEMGTLELGGSKTEMVDKLDNINTLVVSSSKDLTAYSTDEILIEKDVAVPAPKPSSIAIATPWGIDAVKAKQAWALGFRGEGMRVLVLDTGVDKNHPSLVANFEQGRNFVPNNTPGLPYEFFDQVGHGTHVAGTILADGKDGGLVGVAPAAKLLAGKVCGTTSCDTSAILAGVNWAIAEKVHVVNMSLGGPVPSNIARETYRKAAEAGVVVVAASGNDGNGSVSYPAAYPHVIAVGAVDSKLKKAEFSQWGKELDVVAPGVQVLSSVPQGTGQLAQVVVENAAGDKTSLQSAAFEGSPKTEALVESELVFAGLGKPADIAAVNLTGKIALIQRGEIAFADKAKAALNAGAVGVVIFNNQDGLLNGTLQGSISIPVIMITQADGLALADQLKTTTVKVAMGITASDYDEFQGTSMASPHAAGVVTLLRQAHPTLGFAEVEALLKSTATALGPNEQNQYGAGLVNAEAVVIDRIERSSKAN